MVYILNGKLGRIPERPDRLTARDLKLPLYSPDEADLCPDHPDSLRFTISGECQACWKAA